MRVSHYVLVIAIICGVSWSTPHSTRLIQSRPKLLLVIVVDQFRADYLQRFYSRLLPAESPAGELGGFGYLIKKGAYYPQAQYEILQNMTGPGHSTILSGAYPYRSGIPLNQWVDTASGDPVYCVQDKTHHTVEVTPGSSKVGTSPKNFQGTTIGDELKNAGYPSRVVAIALKDRAAILMGGYRADEVIWFEPEYYQWVSSDFYHPDGKLPGWVNELSLGIKKKKGQVLPWKASGLGTGFSLPDNGMLNLDTWTKSSFKLGFPHESQIGMNGSLNGPYGVEVTLDAAEAALDKYKLGAGKSTDVLIVGISSFDYLGHAFGPNSREMEEMTVVVDRAVARLLKKVKRSVPGGLDEAVVLVTADHGIPPVPEWLQKNRMQAGRIDEKALKEKLEAKLKQIHGDVGANWILDIKEMNFYLNPKAFQATGKRAVVETAVVEASLKNLLLEEAGVSYVVTKMEVRERKLPPGIYGQQVDRTYFMGRSGDVVAILRPFYMSGEDTVMHMTSHRYDNTVPLLFSGKHIRSGVYSETAKIVDIAPTLSWLLGTVPPALAEGRVLSEMLQ